jgi:hypothetical protein
VKKVGRQGIKLRFILQILNLKNWKQQLRASNPFAQKNEKLSGLNDNNNDNNDDNNDDKRQVVVLNRNKCELVTHRCHPLLSKIYSQ